MEVLGRRARHGHLDVVVGGELQEPFEPPARVFGTLPLVAVREEQHEPARLPPLLLAGDDELVHDDLRLVDEVAKLRLPAHERVLRDHRLAVLEAERGELVQRRVVDEERRLVA